MKTLMEYFFW